MSCTGTFDAPSWTKNRIEQLKKKQRNRVLSSRNAEEIWECDYESLFATARGLQRPAKLVYNIKKKGEFYNIKEE
ncbi:hypothetical protein Q1695_014621 [Nippostrongylus brasiliensis]|nr:hypothetical protein Q1695_014621 [Nippostrongylus brasiliensis]